MFLQGIYGMVYMIHNDETVHLVLTDDQPAEEPVWTACLVVLHGADVGNKVLLNKDEMTIGRAKDVDVCLTQGGVSRMHAVIRRLNDQEFLLVDKNSTNGTLINSRKIKSEVLRDQDIIVIGDSTLKFLSSDNPEQAYYEELYRKTQMDNELKIYNKHYFLSRLGEEVIRCQYYGNELALVLFDVDHFKQLNDTYGHLAGDEALIRLSEISKSCVRETDVLCRYGGEEFSVIMPNTSQHEAYDVADKLRALVAAAPFDYSGAAIHVTISVGVAGCSSINIQSCGKEFLITQADKALYQAKRSGRNKVMMFGAAV